MNLLNKDEIFSIGMQMDDLSLLNFCKSGKQGAELCKNEYFWARRTVEKFGPSQKRDEETWKNYYMRKVFRRGQEYNQDLYDAARLGDKQEVSRLIQLGADRQYGLDGALYAENKELIEYIRKEEK